VDTYILIKHRFKFQWASSIVYVLIPFAFHSMNMSNISITFTLVMMRSTYTLLFIGNCLISDTNPIDLLKFEY
jgi:hypothetical protein